MRLTRMPEKYAASWFEPIAKIARPSGVACSATAKPTASTAKIAIDQGICVPRDRDDADVRQVLREAAERAVREHDLRDAAVERERADRDRQRGQADAASRAGR